MYKLLHDNFEVSLWIDSFIVLYIQAISIDILSIIEI